MRLLPNFLSKTVSLNIFNAGVALWLTCLLNVKFFQRMSELGAYHGLMSIWFIIATAFVLFGAYFLVLQLLSWKWFAKPLAALLIVIGGVSSYFVTKLGININAGQMLNVMQTDMRETLDLVSGTFLIWCAWSVLLPLVVIFGCIRIQSQSWKAILKAKILAIALTLVGVVVVAYNFYGQYAPIFREHRDLKGLISPMNAISAFGSYTQKHSSATKQPLVHYGEDARLVLKASAQAKPKLMVLIVGETARAESFSLNGYGRLTNPELSKQDIINFTQVHSCGTETAVSVPCMFSGMPRSDYDASLASHREGLLDIVQRAGYQVTWIDNNSGCKKTCDRVQQYVIPDTLKQQWCKGSECHDDILLDSLKQLLTTLAASNKNQLIVLHQMGSHGPAYYKRYPDSMKKFVPTCDTNDIQNCSHEALINSYDNTIVYTDHFLSEIINVLKQQPNYETGMWYLSDHGESTGEHGLYLHGAPYMLAPSQQTHIPMLMWFSQAWQQSAPSVVPCLKAQKAAEHSQDNLFPTVLSLLGVQTQTLNPSLDMLSSCRVS